MNEKPMKIRANRDEVSSPSAQAAGWSIKVRAEHGCSSEKQGLGVEKWLEPPTDEMIITETTGKAEFKP